ncbi:MAG TPA: S-methyl-5-thioribose-1-phosphate isomerase [Chloroflexota bacterium]|nr:S-methyl-5-thioribose-1-phosphate isomerase [Chloroflexota bacterium]
MKAAHIEWTAQHTLRMLDQTKLPVEESWVEARTYQEVASAIKNMVVRGAPLIGVVAAFGLAMAAEQSLEELPRAAEALRATRPTAVNLSWAIERMLRFAKEHPDPAAIAQEAERVADEDAGMARRLSELGGELLPASGGVLTHCNAGALAMVDYGTALGVIRSAWEHGKRINVLVDETRPFLQGSRLTAWELQRLGIPMTLITDNMAGHFMGRGQIQAVVTGADRIAANGDTANKIGTYSLAILAHEHGIPFYVAAPVSTIDLNCPNGDHIPIEERSSEEVTHFGGVQIAPDGVAAAHPAFDVTPARYISAIITNAGVARAPFADALKRFVQGVPAVA